MVQQVWRVGCCKVQCTSSTTYHYPWRKDTTNGRMNSRHIFRVSHGPLRLKYTLGCIWEVDRGAFAVLPCYSYILPHPPPPTPLENLSVYAINIQLGLPQLLFLRTVLQFDTHTPTHTPPWLTHTHPHHHTHTTHTTPHTQTHTFSRWNAKLWRWTCEKKMGTEKTQHAATDYVTITDVYQPMQIETSHALINSFLLFTNMHLWVSYHRAAGGRKSSK